MLLEISIILMMVLCAILSGTSGTRAVVLRKISIITVIVAVVWSFVASWFSAKEILTYSMEMDSYVLAFAAVVCFAFLYASLSKGYCSVLKGSAVVISTILALLLVVIGYGLSDGGFLYWKTSGISPEQWRQMVSDLVALGKEVPKGSPYWDARKLPKSLDALASHRDSNCLFYGGNQPRVIYGSPSGRQWGLMIGSAHLYDRKYPEVLQHVQVADNAYLFVDPNSRD